MKCRFSSPYYLHLSQGEWKSLQVMINHDGLLMPKAPDDFVLLFWCRLLKNCQLILPSLLFIKGLQSCKKTVIFVIVCKKGELVFSPNNLYIHCLSLSFSLVGCRLLSFLHSNWQRACQLIPNRAKHFLSAERRN